MLRSEELRIGMCIDSITIHIKYLKDMGIEVLIRSDKIVAKVGSVDHLCTKEVVIRLS